MRLNIEDDIGKMNIHVRTAGSGSFDNHSIKFTDDALDSIFEFTIWIRLVDLRCEKAPGVK